jgi:hypothetical protein
MDWVRVAVPLGGSFSPRVWLAGMEPIFPTDFSDDSCARDW